MKELLSILGNIACMGSFALAMYCAFIQPKESKPSAATDGLLGFGLTNSL